MGPRLIVMPLAIADPRFDTVLTTAQAAFESTMDAFVPVRLSLSGASRTIKVKPLLAAVLRLWPVHDMHVAVIYSNESSLRCISRIAGYMRRFGRHVSPGSSFWHTLV